MDPVGPSGRTPLQPHQLVERRTPTEDVIVLCHLGVAHVRREDWSLSIDGMVRRPMRLSFADLERRPRTEVESIHQCCGNPLAARTADGRVQPAGGARNAIHHVPVDIAA